MAIVNGTTGNDTLLSGTATADTISGLAGNDRLVGLAGIDGLFGGDGNDTLNGGSEADTLDGGLGVDVAEYTTSTAGVRVTINGAVGVGGDAAGDTLIAIENVIGSAFNDTLIGDGLANVLTGGAGGDQLDGAGGLDTADYSTAAAAISASLEQGVGISGEAQLDTYTGIENLSGSAFNDTLTGDALVNVLTGGNGNDLLDGRGGNDTVFGGDGNDTMIGAAGTDSLVGGLGNDTYVVSVATTVVTEASAAGTDIVEASVTYTLSANVENLTLTGAANINGTGNDLANVLTGNTSPGGSLSQNGNNLLSGLAGNDTIFGGGGNDTLDGGTGNDSMDGGTGNDTFIVDSVLDVLVEAAESGNDLVQSSVNWTLGAAFEDLTLTGAGNVSGTGNALNNTIIGNTGANNLSGLGGDDEMTGGDGNDTLNGGTGVDTMTGGAGDDLYVVDVATDRVVETSTGGNDRVESSVTYTLATNVETLTLTGTTAINGTGNSGNNTLNGNSAANLLQDGFGNDTLNGGAGNDTLNGGTGVDSMVGGTGDDTFVVDNLLDVLVEAASEGTDTVETILNWTLGANFENLTLAGSSGISGTGNAVANIITGNARANLMQGLDGNDTLNGGAGADTLDGGTGADSMTGGADDDVYIVDNAGDVVVEIADGGKDTVQTAGTYVLGSQVENLTLTGAAAVNGTGNDAVNIIAGNTGANVLSGLAGDDKMYGGAGNDTLNGGTGADYLVGGAGDDAYIVDNLGDSVIEVSTGGIDRIDSSISYTTALNIEYLYLTGTDAINGTGNSENNILAGNTAANLLSGGSGNDSLFGGAGNDTLDGGSGADSMVGGGGDDTFIVDATTDVTVEAGLSGTDVVQSRVSWALSDNIENLVLTGTFGINGTGNTLNNVLTGNNGSNGLSGLDGNDTLTGGAGSDTLNGGTGADSMVGGADNDTYVVDNVGDVVVEVVDGGVDTVISSGSYVLGTNVENVTLAGVGAFNATGNSVRNIMAGNADANLLSGLEGNDNMFGGAGNDTLDGGADADSMTGGLGDDVFVVDNIGDRTVENVGGGTDTVNSSITWTIASNVENLTLTGTTAINGTGNTAANVLTGNSAANILTGGAGFDTLVGGAGNDTLNGEAGADSASGGVGDDTYIVDAATDVVFEDVSAGTDTVQSSVSWILGANVENLLLTGSSVTSGTGNDLGNVMTGNARNNVLVGLAGDDTLNGGDGADRLVGGAGNDSLIGGASADAFVFNTLTGGVDTIADFNGLNGAARVGDTMRFEGLLSGTYSYIGGDAFTNTGNTQVRVDGSNVVVDTNGNGVADITIAVTGLTSALQLVSTDFVFV